MQSKTKEFIHKIQKLTDECNDKEERLESLTTQADLLAQDKDTIKNLYDIQMEKYSKLLEENILIPKKKEGTSENVRESIDKSPGKTS